MSNGYIYKITNLVNGKIYIGQTIRSVKRRLQSHIWEAHRWNNKKLKTYNSKLFSAINKYGDSNFKIEIIHEIKDNENIDELEKYYIKLYNSQDDNIGYNISEGGKKHPIKFGWNPSEEVRKKMAEIQSGKHWYNNGEIEIMVLKNQEVPEGFYLGRLKGKGFKKGCENPSRIYGSYNKGKPMRESSKLKLRQSLKELNENRKMVWYNDGVHEILINILYDNPPNNYKKGRIRKENKSSKPIVVYDTLMDTYFSYISISEMSKDLKCSYFLINKSLLNNLLLLNRYKCEYKELKMNTEVTL